MEIRIDHEATLTRSKPQTLSEIRNRLTFPNPAYLENEKRGYSNHKTDRLIQCYDTISGGLSFPRGFTGQAIRIAKQNSELITIEDRRRSLSEVNFTFGAKLKPFHSVAVDAVLKKKLWNDAGPNRFR